MRKNESVSALLLLYTTFWTSRPSGLCGGDIRLVQHAVSLGIPADLEIILGRTCDKEGHFAHRLCLVCKLQDSRTAKGNFRWQRCHSSTMIVGYTSSSGMSFGPHYSKLWDLPRTIQGWIVCLATCQIPMKYCVSPFYANASTSLLKILWSFRQQLHAYIIYFPAFWLVRNAE